MAFEKEKKMKLHATRLLKEGGLVTELEMPEMLDGASLWAGEDQTKVGKYNGAEIKTEFYEGGFRTKLTLIIKTGKVNNYSIIDPSFTMVTNDGEVAYAYHHSMAQRVLDCYEQSQEPVKPSG
jgi:hypothetical protein